MVVIPSVKVVFKLSVGETEWVGETTELKVVFKFSLRLRLKLPPTDEVKVEFTVSLNEREWVGVTLDVKVVLRVSERDRERLAVVEILDERVVFMFSEMDTLIPEDEERFSAKVTLSVSPTFIPALVVTLELKVEFKMSEREMVGLEVTVPVKVVVIPSDKLTL